MGYISRFPSRFSNYLYRHVQSITKEFTLDILPSILSFVMAVIWVFSEKGTWDKSGVLPFIYRTAILCVSPSTAFYLISHPVGFNLSFYSKYRKTDVEEIMYNMIRSVLYGSAATIVFDYAAWQIITKHFPEYVDYSWLFDSEWSLKRAHLLKCIGFSLLVLIFWFFLMVVAWLGAYFDFDEWAQLAAVKTEEQSQESRRTEVGFFKYLQSQEKKQLLVDRKELNFLLSQYQRPAISQEESQALDEKQELEFLVSRYMRNQKKD